MLAFSPDGMALASGGLDKMVKLWDVATQKEAAALKGHTGTVVAVACSPDGKTLPTCSTYERCWGTTKSPASE